MERVPSTTRYALLLPIMFLLCVASSENTTPALPNMTVETDSHIPEFFPGMRDMSEKDLDARMNAIDPMNITIAETRLVNSLLTGYNRYVEPPVNTVPTIIYTYIFNVLGLESHSQILTLFATLAFVIPDARLKWNSGQHAGIHRTFVACDKIWLPPFVHVGGSRVNKLAFDEMTCVIMSNGYVLWIVSDVFSFPCNLDASLYPFDNQICQMSFTYSTGATPTMNFTCAESPNSVDYLVPNSEWGMKASKCTFRSQKGFAVAVSLNRKPLFHIVNLLLPIACLSLMNSFTFLLPVEAGERISFCVTVFLAFTVFISYVSTTVPISSENVPYLSYVLASQAIISIATLFSNVVLVRLHHLSDPLPKMTSSTSFGKEICSSDNSPSSNGCQGDRGEPEIAEPVLVSPNGFKVDTICFVVSICVSILPFAVYIVAVFD